MPSDPPLAPGHVISCPFPSLLFYLPPTPSQFALISCLFPSLPSHFPPIFPHFPPTLPRPCVHFFSITLTSPLSFPCHFPYICFPVPTDFPLVPSHFAPSSRTSPAFPPISCLCSSHFPGLGPMPSSFPPFSRTPQFPPIFSIPILQSAELCPLSSYFPHNSPNSLPTPPPPMSTPAPWYVGQQKQVAKPTSPTTLYTMLYHHSPSITPGGACAP